MFPHLLNFLNIIRIECQKCKMSAFCDFVSNQQVTESEDTKYNKKKLKKCSSLTMAESIYFHCGSYLLSYLRFIKTIFWNMILQTIGNTTSYVYPIITIPKHSPGDSWGSGGGERNSFYPIKNQFFIVFTFVLLSPCL